MAGVAVRKADDPSLQDELDQRYAQLPPEFLPTAQQIQDTISDTGIARTPQEFEQTEPLGGRNERARQGYTAKRYLNRLATEGALAEGLVRRKFPLLDEYNVDATKLPVLRDYTSRQTTLPEHDLGMQTEGPHFDEHGNILPGAIPPVNAVKRLSAPDIQHIGSAGNFGLKPVKDARVNFEWERSIPTYHDAPIDLARRPIFPVKNAGFVSPINARDVRQAEAGNVDPRNPEGFVAIRGFGAPSDKAFSRKDISEGREGIYTAPIPPERLVGIHRKGGIKEKDLSQNILTSVFDDENIAQQINLPDNIPKRDFILNEMRLADLNNDSNQFAIEMDTLYELGEISEEEYDAVLNAFDRGQMLQRKRNREELPEEWSQGSFGFNNPTLTPEEKKQYERQIMEILSQTSAGRSAGPVGIQDIQDYLRQGHSPVLNPRPVKKALPRHWSKDFDTTEDLRNVLRQARLMSLEDAKNIENIPLRPDVRDWELSHTAQGMKSIIPGIQEGKITDQGYVDEGGAFTYPPQLQSFLPMINPDARMSVTMPDIPGSMGKPSGRPNVLVGSFEKPEFHATQKEGRVQTEGFMPGGFDHSQAVLLTEPSRAFPRQEVPMAIQNLVGGKMKDYAPGTFGYDEPVGRAMESFNILPYSGENPLSQFSGWGQPRTVDDVFQLSEPMDIAMRLLKMPFHGTTEDAIEGGRFFGGIKRRGLQPKSPRDGHPKNVFFTDNPIDAASYAKRGANQQNSRPVLIEFPESDIPTESKQSPWYAGNYRTTNQTIPSTNFQYHYGPQREEGMTDEEYNMQTNKWMLNTQNLVQPQVQQPQVQQPQVQQPQMIQQGEPMDIAMRLLKRQTTLSAFDERQIQENLKPENSNIFIAAKPGNEETRPGELSQLSDNMLAELAALKEKHGEFGITSATGNAAWDLEPSFMLTNVPQSARGEINTIAEKYRQDSIAVSEKNETGAKFVTPQGQVTDEYRNMQMDPDAEYSTDFSTGQRLTFKSEPMDIAMRLLKERVSPEAKRHKLEYDKKYESSPERVKYREDLNRERRRRGIYGSHNHKDVSHTEGGKLTLEGEHENRARHFKDKGTLRHE